MKAEVSDTGAKSGWTFLSNHLHVIFYLNRNPQAVLREVALAVGITERAVQRIVSDLEAAGYLEKVREGRRNHYRIVGKKNLRHPLEAHHTLGELLQLLK